MHINWNHKREREKCLENMCFSHFVYTIWKMGEYNLCIACGSLLHFDLFLTVSHVLDAFLNHFPIRVVTSNDNFYISLIKYAKEKGGNELNWLTSLEVFHNHDHVLAIFINFFIIFFFSVWSTAFLLIFIFFVIFI